MAAFEYVALDGAGRRTRGVVAADTARAARREIKQRRLTLIKLEESKGARARPGTADAGAGRGSITETDRVLITRQLAMLLQAGTPLEEGLNAIAQQAPKQRVRKALLQVRSSVTEGFRFSEALAQAGGGAFSPLYRAMAAAGEATGDLGAVLARLADLLEKARVVRQKILAAVVYPIVLAVVALIVVASLMIFVVPRVVEQFESFDEDLPLITDVVIALSDALQRYGLIAALAVAGGALAFSRALAIEPFRLLTDKILLKTPVIGDFVRAASAARFARTMGALVQSGVPALDALEASKMTLGNLVLRDAVDSMTEAVRRGGAVGAAMQAAGVFPALLTFLASSGERSGELGAMFEKGADYLESETETRTTIALNLLEPMIIVFMGAVVALIVLAIMMPILRLNALALG